MKKTALLVNTLFFIGLFSTIGTGQNISHSVLDGGNREIWQIDQPPVKQRESPITQVKFAYLDEIAVEAGGCVNTHGFGKTSKRYVDPSGPNSDSKYFGLIRIPGITADLDKIANYIGKQNILLKPPHIDDPSELFLTLGYVDDDYNDNDYKDQDEGNDDQCKNVGNAWVKLTVIHHTEADVPGVPHPKAPLDVWWSAIDDNYLPHLPLFGSEYFGNGHPNAITLCDRFPNGGDNTGYGTPPCTTQRPSVDEPSGYASVVCQRDHPEGTVHGHVNWFNVTYSGNVFFHDWQKGFFEDDDLDLYALTGNKGGNLLTNYGDPRLIGLEFKHSETVQNFDTPWWNTFKANLEDDGAGWLRIRQAIDGKPVYISGLFGVDNQHEVYTEIHPVHFFAVKYDENMTMEKWAFFARNWGNEGFCSQDYHGLSVNTYQFFIPNAASIDLAQTIIKVNNSNLGVSYTIFADGILLSMKMPPRQQYGLWHGEITVRKASPKVDPKITYDPAVLAKLMGSREPEGFASFANLLTKHELKKWKKRFEKATAEIDKQERDFVTRQTLSSSIVTLAADNGAPPPRPRRRLDITEERVLPAESRQMRFHDSFGTLKKDLLYTTLNESLKAKRKAIIFAASSNKPNQPGQQPKKP